MSGGSGGGGGGGVWAYQLAHVARRTTELCLAGQVASNVQREKRVVDVSSL
jgi:hypothetical protein